MANELHLNDASLTGSTLYAVVWDEAGQAWNGTAFAAYTTIRGDFDVAATEIVGTGFWRATFPGAAGYRRWAWFLQAGGAPSHVDDVKLLEGTGYWDGANIDVAAINTKLGAWPGAGQDILGAFRALLRKDADAAVPAIINANLGGGVGTVDNVTDSLQAMRDNVGTAGAALTAVSGGGAVVKVDNTKVVESRTVRLGTRADGVYVCYPAIRPVKGEILPWWIDTTKIAGGVWLASVANPVSSDASAAAVVVDGTTPRVGVNQDFAVVWIDAVGADGHAAATITFDLTPDGGQTIKASLSVEVQGVTAVP